MKKIAMVKNGVVENISIWDMETPWNPEGYELYDVTDKMVNIGDIYDGEQFVHGTNGSTQIIEAEPIDPIMPELP